MISQFLSLLSIGVGLGAVYAVGAVGLALIFRMTGILHFAHGAVFVVASYVLLGTTEQGVPLLIAVPLALVVGGISGVVVYEGVYRPLERRGVSELGFVISSFGVLVVSQNAMTLGFGSTARSVVLVGWISHKAFRLGAVTLRAADLVALVVAVSAIAGFAYFRLRSRTGLLLRALEGNKRLAADLGISYRRYASVIFLLGSLFAAVAAVMSSFTVPVAPDGGLQWTVWVYIAMAVGGTGSIWSAALGGLVLGILSTVPDLWLPGSWNVVLAFGVLVVILLIKPNGLMAARDPEAERVSPFALTAAWLTRQLHHVGGESIAHADTDGTR
jgi:branched-subunit amino acid ABC-type transport system permease component